MERPQRKSPRLRGYGYGPGCYFLTFCTKDKRCILSEICVGEGLAPPERKLSRLGRIAEEQIGALPSRFAGLSVEKYVVMPNHIHLLIQIGEAGWASPSPTVPDIMRVLKSQITRIGGEGGIFQRSYHDHVVRGEADYRKIWQYIDQNPAKWAEDCFYRKSDL